MKDDRPQQPATGQPATASDHKEDKNPFRDEVPVQQPAPEEEAAAEQQRKEALTERD